MQYLQRWILAGAALACLSGAACAQGLQFAGSLQVGYARYALPSKNADGWTANGSAVLTIDNPGIDLQANFDDTGLRPDQQSKDYFAYGGDAFWRDYAGDIGFNVETTAVLTGAGTNYTSWGAFAQWFALPEATLEAKGGRLSGGYNGYYADGGAVVYPLSQIALELGIDYARGSSRQPEMADAALTAEFMPIRDLPFSLSLGYSRAEFHNLSGDRTRGVNVLTAALKFYLGGSSASGSLRDYQQYGPTDWDRAPPDLIGFGF